MPLGVNIFSADRAIANQAIRRVLGLFVLPLVVFAWVVVWQYRVTPHVQPLAEHAVWWEPLGQVEFTPDYLQQLAVRPPDFSAAQWTPAVSPATTPAQPTMGTQKFRVWLRITPPEELVVQSAHEGRLAILINRIVCSGPWSAWAQGHLLQTNRADWGLQWNTPLRLVLPVDARTVYLGLPVIPTEGFAYGTALVGTADQIAMAWQNRDLWMTNLPRAASVVALLLALMTLPMTLQHRQDPVYALFTANALVWSATNLQYLYDITGNPGQSTWFGLVMDLSVNWNVMLTLLFAFEFQPRRMPWVTGALLAYAALSSLLAIGMKAAGAYSLVANHMGNAVAFTIGLAVYIYRFSQAPSREGAVLLLVLLGALGAGTHTLMYVSNMSHPDHVFTFPYAVLGSFFAFLYAVSRRSAQAIRVAQQHQAELTHRLAEQKVQLQSQHQHIAKLELRQQLASQRELMRQDLHDGLGSNLTSALFQARKGQLSQQDTVLLLQEMAQELRQLSAQLPASLGLNDVLAELRQRIQRRLAQGGVTLRWNVAPSLPALAQLPAEAGTQLRALLNEAVANVIKHSQASSIDLSTCVMDGHLCVQIADNGIGFDPQGSHTGRGLKGMAARAQSMGWRLAIESASGHGCRWVLRIPVPTPV